MYATIAVVRYGQELTGRKIGKNLIHETVDM